VSDCTQELSSYSGLSILEAGRPPTRSTEAILHALSSFSTGRQALRAVKRSPATPERVSQGPHQTRADAGLLCHCFMNSASFLASSTPSYRHQLTVAWASAGAAASSRETVSSNGHPSASFQLLYRAHSCLISAHLLQAEHSESGTNLRFLVTT